MATTGSAYKAFGRHRLVAEWTNTSQNIANNTSAVTLRVYLQSMDGYGAMYAPATNAGNTKLNGVTKNFSANSNLNANQKKLLTTQTFSVPHNADGSKSFSYSATFNINVTFAGTYYGNQTVSGTGVLNAIPRASTIGNISGSTIGSAITIPITRASGAFTHDVSITLGSKVVSTSGATTSATLTPDMAFCNQIPNSTNGSATIKVVTKNGSTVIGTTTKAHTINVPASVVPSTPSLNVVEGIQAVKNLALGATTFVQNKSRLDMTSSASGSYGSTIRDYTFSFNGVNQGGTVGRQFNVGGAVGTKEVKVVVTDSRGRKSQRAFNVTVLAYSPPRVNTFNVYRESNGTTLKATINYTVTNIGNKGGTWYVDQQTGSTWTLRNSGTFTTTHSSTITIAGAYDVTKSYNFRTNLHDSFGHGATAQSAISTAKTLLDLNQDKGVGVGKVHEKGVLDVEGASYFKGKFETRASLTDSNGNEELLSSRRVDGTMAMTITNHASRGISLHLYNGDGSWVRNHNFKPGGQVELNGRLSVGGDITNLNGRFYQMGVPIHTNRDCGLLWSGASWMNSDQSITMPKSIDEAPTGWILVMQAYQNGAVVNRDFSYSIIHKTQPNVGFHVPVYWDYGDKQAGRYMYLRNRNRLEGARTNAINSPQGGGIVLSKVIEF